MFKNRSTVDVVIILMTLIIGFVLLAGTVGIIIGKLTGLDTKTAAEAIQNIVTTLVGALVGFVGGRATGRAEANGGK